MRKIKGLKKACGEMNNNKNLNRTVMYDRGTGEVWIDVFADQNSWNEYHDKNIISVMSKREGMWNNYEHTSMAEIREAIERRVVEEKAEEEMFNALEKEGDELIKKGYYV